MKRVLVTGATGFVAGHLIPLFKREYIVHGISRTPRDGCMRVDMQNVSELKQAVSASNPDYIIHLASQSSVEQSWKCPSDSFANNTGIFLNLMDVVREIGTAPRILSVGSSEQYGTVSQTNLPIEETYSLNPTSPYAIARVAQEHLALLFASNYDMDIVCTRSFNHCGVGQGNRFVIPSIINQFGNIRSGLQAHVISVGNKNAVRDFIDVRDVVNAYQMLLKTGKSGNVYNICSGTGRSIEVVVNMISDLLDIPVEITENISAARPFDNPVIIGCNNKMSSEIGWKPRIPFEQSIRDICEVAFQ